MSVFSTLPVELQIQVLSHIYPWDLLPLTSVCKLWHSIITSPTPELHYTKQKSFFIHWLLSYSSFNCKHPPALNHKKHPNPQYLIPKPPSQPICHRKLSLIGTLYPGSTRRIISQEFWIENCAPTTTSTTESPHLLPEDFKKLKLPSFLSNHPAILSQSLHDNNTSKNQFLSINQSYYLNFKPHTLEIPSTISPTPVFPPTISILNLMHQTWEYMRLSCAQGSLDRFGTDNTNSVRVISCVRYTINGVGSDGMPLLKLVVDCDSLTNSTGQLFPIPVESGHLPDIFWKDEYKKVERNL
ncbi:hypothetical protein TWF192_003255 [Orbilia oligospora]|uniref:F-box domain-containing protein n=1 Tax=Orbilia oligospora TaxID=2813651 RepID=A0A6G1MDA3_ORBOL|nr:hypothetical protein TWF679_006887 [Orbilia oligospora]KAF3225304.1 hypothetical protein TWF191_005354 [Orbilia oligospora]KAF3254493.1 hypothetical protein TWF192_003255 [Orbilia oligospora]